VNVAGPSAAIPAAAPDWAAQREDLLCPLCEYNLRGLTDPRCPECGYRFDWDQLRDERLKTHPYLFEHHPERNAWSFQKTARGGLLPGRFWHTLHPGQPSRPRRLLAYWVLVMAIALSAGVVAPTLMFAVLVNADFRAEVTRRNTVAPDGTVLYWSPTAGYRSTPPTLPGPFTPEGGLDAALRDVAIPYAVWWATAAAWPWMTIGALLIFRISMSRAKLKPIHVRRCVLYSFDACLWASLVVLALSLLAFAMGFGANRPRLLDEIAVWCLPVLWVGAIYRMSYAYQDYLGFEHAFQTVILSQIIVALAAFIAFGSILGWMEGH
jgi:hypothetical protein